MSEYEAFAHWVAERVCNEDFDAELFAELALRKLYKMGIVQLDKQNDLWVYEESAADTYCTDETCETFLRDLNCERCNK